MDGAPVQDGPASKRRPCKHCTEIAGERRAIPPPVPRAGCPAVAGAAAAASRRCASLSTCSRKRLLVSDTEPPRKRSIVQRQQVEPGIMRKLRTRGAGRSWARRSRGGRPPAPPPAPSRPPSNRCRRSSTRPAPEHCAALLPRLPLCARPARAVPSGGQGAPGLRLPRQAWHGRSALRPVRACRWQCASNSRSAAGSAMLGWGGVGVGGPDRRLCTALQTDGIDAQCAGWACRRRTIGAPAGWLLWQGALSALGTRQYTLLSILDCLRTFNSERRSSHGFACQVVPRVWTTPCTVPNPRLCTTLGAAIDAVFSDGTPASQSAVASSHLQQQRGEVR